jgi:Yip1-like protein
LSVASLWRPVRFIKNNSVKSSSPFAGAVLACLGEVCQAAPALMLIPYLASGISPKVLNCNYAKIKKMKAEIPQPVHESYQRHRRQRTSQIILPVVLAVLLCLALVVLINIATFRDNGDVARWAAISTMWIVIPIIIASLIFLAVLAGIIYLLARLLGSTPYYTGKAQDFVNKLAIHIRRFADMAVKPIIALNGFGASINRLLGRK